MRRSQACGTFLFLAACAWPLQGWAQPAASPETFMAPAQATHVVQFKPAFSAPYSGQNSLLPERERSFSSTITVFFGWRLSNAWEVFFNPEVAAGSPLSNLTGLGGLTNGELARTSGPDPTFYRARLFTRYTHNLAPRSGEAPTETLDADANQFPKQVSTRRWVATVGNLSALDVFDGSAYAKDPRRHFLNWSLFAPGAWDFPADARGYTWGAALEYYDGPWALRFGRFIMPRQSNGLRLNEKFWRSWGDALELTRSWGDDSEGSTALPGQWRVLLFNNRAAMGSYPNALALGQQTGTPPDLAATRVPRDKSGLALGFEQALHRDVGVFARASINSGKAETFAFTEIDQSLSLGTQIMGTSWGRAQDQVGIAIAQNGLSSSHRNYLAAGGLGFFLGEGQLNYRPEQILEAYYRWEALKGVELSAGAQWINNPGYNADRGPVRLWSLRVHLRNF